MATADTPDSPPAGDAPAAPSRRYALALDEVEVTRYRLMAEEARAAEAELWRLAGIVEGARVADVGCGPGALLPALADAVAPTGWVTAVDADPGAVAAATALVAATGLANVTVKEGRADRTGLAAESCDVVMLRHVLAHNGGSEDAIVAHLATYLIRPVPPGMRPPPWAARDAMVAAGLASDGDIARWATAFALLDAASTRPTLFAPLFTAVGRRPA